MMEYIPYQGALILIVVFGLLFLTPFVVAACTWILRVTLRWWAFVLEKLSAPNQ